MPHIPELLPAWRIRRAGGLAAAFLCCLALSGCPSEKGPKGPRKPVRVRLQSFSEAAPVRVIAVASTYAFVASDRGVVRWDLNSGEGLHLTADDGLAGDTVVSMVADLPRSWVWIATDTGLTRYDAGSSTFSEVPPPPSSLGIDSLEGAVLEPAGDGGLWIGLPKGLFHTDGAGEWNATPLMGEITALFRATDGTLWIGTKGGLIARQVDGKTYRYGDAQGCGIVDVRAIVRAPNGGPLVLGSGVHGKQRIVLLLDDRCATFRASPDQKWIDVLARKKEVVVRTARRLYTLRAPRHGARHLRRDGMRLVPVKVGESPTVRSPYVLRVLDLRLPAGARTVAVADDEILVGTRTLGTARLFTGRRRGRSRWLRRSVLVEGASSLSVACAKRNDCYVATGSTRAWRFNGDSFLPLASEDLRVLAVARSPSGDVYGLRRGEDDQHVVLARLLDGVWLRVSEIALETPGGQPEISFARFSPSGVLWVGLHFRDAAGEMRPYGVALVDVALGAVAYHHASGDASETAQGVLPIPVNVVDASFLDENETWLATTEGAARIRGQEVVVYTEAEGLRSEFLRGVACSVGGMVFIASGQGVGTFDGETWSYPPSLRWPVNDIEIARDSRLWMATDRGVAVFDGARVRRLDVRRGLLENQIEDVAIDHFGRVWVRGSRGLTIVTP